MGAPPPTTTTTTTTTTGATLERRRPRPLTIARSPPPTTTTSITARALEDDDDDDDQEVVTIGSQRGKSAARRAIERALGGAFDYAAVARDALQDDDDARRDRGRATVRDDEDGWRAFASDDARAFAAETRRDVERRIRAIDDEIERAARARREKIMRKSDVRGHAVGDVVSDDRDRRKGVKSRYLEAVNARRDDALKHRAKTSVAFGSTIRA